VDGVRQAQIEDVPGIVALQSACFPPPFPPTLHWRPEHIGRHLELFPEGQFVAYCNNLVIGSASSLLISDSRWGVHLPWVETTGGFSFASHEPDGEVLFGADISVHPDWRGRGVGRELYRARFEVVRRQRLKRYGTACRLPGWRSWAESRNLSGLSTNQEDYCGLICSGEISDRTLTPLLKYGLRYVGVAHEHMDDDESGNAAAVLEWTP
jgi:GNAT superfamily N-acetyltransferase